MKQYNDIMIIVGLYIVISPRMLIYNNFGPKYTMTQSLLKNKNSSFI